MSILSVHKLLTVAVSAILFFIHVSHLSSQCTRLTLDQHVNLVNQYVVGERNVSFFSVYYKLVYDRLWSMCLFRSLANLYFCAIKPQKLM